MGRGEQSTRRSQRLVRIAALDDIIDSKRAAGRAKDERALPFLESLSLRNARSPGRFIAAAR